MRRHPLHWCPALVRRKAPLPSASGVARAQPGIGVWDELADAVRQARSAPVCAVGSTQSAEVVVVVVLVKLSPTIGDVVAIATVANASAAPVPMDPAITNRRTRRRAVK